MYVKISFAFWFGRTTRRKPPFHFVGAYLPREPCGHLVVQVSRAYANKGSRRDRCAAEDSKQGEKPDSGGRRVLTPAMQEASEKPTKCLPTHVDVPE